MSEQRAHMVIRTLGIVAFCLLAGIALVGYAYHQAELSRNDRSRLATEQAEWMQNFRVVLESFGALNNGPTCQIMVRPDTLRIHYMTDAGERITGRSVSELRGKPITEIIPQPIVAALLNAAIIHPGQDIEFDGGGLTYPINHTEASVSLYYRATWNVDDFLVFELHDPSRRVQIPAPEGMQSP